MKKVFPIVSLIVLLLSGCSTEPVINPTSNSTSNSSTTSSDPTPKEGDVKIKIYATNDIHGQIYPEDPDGVDGRLGLGKAMTFLKEKKDSEKNVLLLDQGDTWQGSLYSNFNRGELITDVMNYVRFDARTIGNHDFDWGPNEIRKNTAKSYNGYKTPVLGANIYDYDFASKKFGDTQQSDLGIPSVTYTFDGVKVGIIGTIGSSQITSINSIYMHKLGFKDHIDIIKEEATKLRNEGCKVVISSVHAGQESVIGNNLKDYVDLVLCGHTHKCEAYKEGNLLFAQFSEYTKMIGDIDLVYNTKTQKVSVSCRAIQSAELNQMVDHIDPEIENIIDYYADKTSDEHPDEIMAAYVDGDFGEYYEGPHLMANAIYDYAIAEGYDIDLAYTNQLRHDLYEGSWTYADIYQAAPFDNEVYIIEVTADEIKNEIMKYNNICKAEGSLYIESGKTYKVACIDYLAFHTNSRRYYDYFPSMTDHDITSLPKLDKTYRLILKDWLLDSGYDDPEKPLWSTDYRSWRSKFNKNEIVFVS